jgi:hypothetical protein
MGVIGKLPFSVGCYTQKSSALSAFRSILLLCTIIGVTEPASALSSDACQAGSPCVKGHYDGAGRNASDNNTLPLFLWVAI